MSLPLRPTRTIQHHLYLNTLHLIPTAKATLFQQSDHPQAPDPGLPRLSFGLFRIVSHQQTLTIFALVSAAGRATGGAKDCDWDQPEDLRGTYESSQKAIQDGVQLPQLPQTTLLEQVVMGGRDAVSQVNNVNP